jgi:hypothetical protein
MMLHKNRSLELLISSIFFLLVFFFFNNRINESIKLEKLNDAKFQELISLNLNLELNEFLLDDYINFYYKNKDIIEISKYFEDLKVPDSLKKRNQTINSDFFFKLLFQFLNFSLYFSVILFFLYHLIERFAWLRFLLRRNSFYNNPKQQFDQAFKCLKNKNIFQFLLICVKLISLIFIKYASYFFLLSPSFIIAYMFRFSALTDNLFIFIFLVIFTNGILFSYLDKYYQLIESEINKEYVILAKIKGLNFNFSMRLTSIFSLLVNRNLRFTDHILNHVHMNVKKSHLLNLKELSVFLISSMLITEMSLNIQEHFSYELLKQLLAENFHIVILMIFLVYLLIKLTEIASDYFYYKKYTLRRNRAKSI